MSLRYPAPKITHVPGAETSGTARAARGRKGRSRYSHLRERTLGGVPGSYTDRGAAAAPGAAALAPGAAVPRPAGCAGALLFRFL